MSQYVPSLSESHLASTIIRAAFQIQRLCLVFCTADIPPDALDDFLDLSNDAYDDIASESCKNFDKQPHKAHTLTVEDLSNITSGTETPVQPFVSPFLGKNIDEIKTWFNENVTKSGSDVFMPYCFIVLDEQTLEDGTCLFVCTEDGPPDSLRCDFELAIKNAVTCDVGESSIQDGLMGSYVRSETIMTVDNLKLAQSKGCYIEGGEVKQDEDWREFYLW